MQTTINYAYHSGLDYPLNFYNYLLTKLSCKEDILYAIKILIIIKKTLKGDILVDMKVLLANPARRVPINEKSERLFIKPGSRWPCSTIKIKDEKNSNIFFPFYLAYSANILKQNGHEVYVIDGVAMDLQDSEFLERVKKINPEIMVIETTTHSINYDMLRY